MIAETKPDYVLILPWNLKDEITAQLAYIRSWGGRFVVPIPSCGELTGAVMADPTGEASRGALRLDFDRHPAAAISRLCDHLRCRVAALP